MVNVGIIGCGFVGAACSFALMQSGLFSEIVLIDSDKNKAEGEALDISHGVSFAKPVKIYAGSYDDIKDAGLIIITAGANQKPGETRLDLVKKNISIFKSILPEIKNRKFDGILLVVANPVDILTTVALKLSGLPQDKVLIRMNVDNFKEAYDILIANGFTNTRGDGSIETSSSKAATMVSPSGFSISLVEHKKD